MSLVAQNEALRAALAVATRRIVDLCPIVTAHNNGCRVVSALLILPQHDKSSFAFDLRAIGALCTATRREESLWSALSRVQHGVERRTVLMHAAHNGDVARLQWLLERNARPDAQDASGKTALAYACERGHTNAVCTLIKMGASVNIPTIHPRTPLFTAARLGHVNIVSVLVKAGAVLDGLNQLNYMTSCGVVSSENITALFIASAYGYVDVVRILIAAGANVNIGMRGGITPLLYATIRHNGLVVYTLLYGGAYFSARTASYGPMRHIFVTFAKEKLGLTLQEWKSSFPSPFN